MEVLFFVVGAAALFIVVLMASNFGKDPTRKSTSQLMRELELHHRRISAIPLSDPKLGKAIEAMEVVQAELERRGEIEKSAKKSQKQEAPSPEKLKDMAEQGYLEGWSKAKADGKSDAQAHETALVSALLKRIENEPDTPRMTEEVIGSLAMEMLPFKMVARDDGREAVIDYIVWREHPEAVDVDRLTRVVRSGINTMRRRDREQGGSDVVEGLIGGPWPWKSLCD